MAPAADLAASDIYPAVRRFLLESGLTRTLKAFNKETLLEGEEGCESERSGPFAEADLVDVCRIWLRTHAASGEAARKKKKQPVDEVADVEPAAAASKKDRKAASAADPEEASSKKEDRSEGTKEKSKKKRSIDEEDAAAVAADAPADGAPPKQKKKRARDAEEVDQEEEAPKPADAEEAAAPKKKKKKDGAAEPKQPTFFQREDWDKWANKIQDDKLKNNSYEAHKQLHVDSGDTYADKAADDLGKVKGKGFRKEMAKKKRASWRGGGEIDQGVKSVKFADASSDED